MYLLNFWVHSFWSVYFKAIHEGQDCKQYQQMMLNESQDENSKKTKQWIEVIYRFAFDCCLPYYAFISLFRVWLLLVKLSTAQVAKWYYWKNGAVIGSDVPTAEQKFVGLPNN